MSCHLIQDNGYKPKLSGPWQRRARYRPYLTGIGTVTELEVATYRVSLNGEYLVSRVLILVTVKKILITEVPRYGYISTRRKSARSASNFTSRRATPTSGRAQSMLTIFTCQTLRCWVGRDTTCVHVQFAHFTCNLRCSALKNKVDLPSW